MTVAVALDWAGMALWMACCAQGMRHGARSIRRQRHQKPLPPPIRPMGGLATAALILYLAGALVANVSGDNHQAILGLINATVVIVCCTLGWVINRTADIIVARIYSRAGGHATE